MSVQYTKGSEVSTKETNDYRTLQLTSSVLIVVAEVRVHGAAEL